MVRRRVRERSADVRAASAAERDGAGGLDPTARRTAPQLSASARSQASPARVRRMRRGAPSESASRWNGAARVIVDRDDVTRSRHLGPPRAPRSARGGCLRRVRSGGASRRPSCPRLWTSTSTCRPTSCWFSCGDALLQRDEPLVALLHDRPSAPGRPWVAGVPGRIEYWKVNAEANRAGSTTPRRLRSPLGLAGEAHDDVGRDRGVRDASRTRSRMPRNFVGAVRPAHRLEDAVGARLQRHVQLRHDGGVSAIASMTSSVNAAGCGLVKRMRSRPSISPAARRSLPNACRSPNSTP